MTRDNLPLIDALLNGGGGDFLRRVLVEGLQDLMESDVRSHTNASLHEHNPDRTVQRNGYRHRPYDTPLGTLDLAVPKLRKGSYFPAFLEPGKRIDSALLSVVQEAYINGVSTRRVDDLIKALGCSGISASEVSRLCARLDADVAAFRNRPLKKHLHYLWLDATWIKVREGGRFVSKAVVIAAGVNEDGTRELLGVGIDLSESEASWGSFLETLRERGLQTVDLVISDAHKGLRAAAEKAFQAPLQRCRVHWLRNLLAKVAVKDRKAVAAAVKPIFEQETFEEGIKVWDLVCDGFAKTCPRAHTFMLENRDDVLVYLTYPEEHHSKISSTNILERVNREIKRRTKVAGIFPTDNSVLRLVGSILLSMNDDWATGNRCFSVDSLAKIEEYRQKAAEKQRLMDAALSEDVSQK